MQRLRALGMETPPGLVFAPVDFEHQTLSSGLSAVGFDFSAPAVFSWLGVTLYLTLDAINATLATVARCPSGTRIVLTYNLPRDALVGMGAETDAALGSIAAEVGEPIVSLFLPAEIETLLRAHGFADVDELRSRRGLRHILPGTRRRPVRRSPALGHRDDHLVSVVG